MFIIHDSTESGFLSTVTNNAKLLPTGSCCLSTHTVHQWQNAGRYILMFYVFLPHIFPLCLPFRKKRNYSKYTLGHLVTAPTWLLEVCMHKMNKEIRQLKHSQTDAFIILQGDIAVVDVHVQFQSSFWVQWATWLDKFKALHFRQTYLIHPPSYDNINMVVHS